MFRTRHFSFLINYFKQGYTERVVINSKVIKNHLHITCVRSTDNSDSPKDVSTIDWKFKEAKNKNKDTYLTMIKIFTNRDVVHRRGHVEFIYSALENMQEFGVHRDLQVYKALIDVLPKGKFVPKNAIQAEFMHYPKQQQCVIDLLEQMEDNGVMPDPEMETMLLNTFGRKGYPLRKYWRMMYWMPKFKNLSPWPVPRPPPNDAFELAQMAISRISSVDVQTKISIYHSAELQDSIEDTWIVSSQSPTQRKLLEELKDTEPVFVEGPYKVWLRNKAVNYFVLRANAKPIPEDDEDPDDVSDIKVSTFNFVPPQKKSLANVVSVHEQMDGIILSLCATGTSSKDSLLSWIRHLEKDGNPTLAKVPVVFSLKSTGKEIQIQDDSSSAKEKIEDR